MGTMLIDIHQHVICGVDDGAKNEEDSLAMLRAAAAQGVGGIVCTAHDAPGVRALDQARYKRQLERLRALAAREGIPVELYSGSELLMTPEAVRALREGRVLTLGESRSVLTEFYPDIPWQLMRSAAEEAAAAGYRLVLAHAERYECLRALERVRTLRDELRVSIQINADTVLRMGRPLAGRWTRELVRAGLADAAASDAHGTAYRPCRLGECHALLKKKYGPELADRLCAQAPARLLESDTGEDRG